MTLTKNIALATRFNLANAIVALRAFNKRNPALWAAAITLRNGDIIVDITTEENVHTVIGYLRTEA